MIEGIWLTLRTLFLCLSFVGLCAGARCVFGLNRFVAPFFAASGVIVALMLAGMAHLLKPGFDLLYCLGFVGLYYVYIFRREKPDYALIAGCGLYLLFLVWRFSQGTLTKNDDLSHWGLVARHLLRTDAFPDASTHTVLFQAYPLGSAAFIYYACRTLTNAEGAWLIAQEFLTGLAFLPLLARAEKNRSWLYPLAACVFFFLQTFLRELGSLRVDELLGFYGVGMAACVCHYREKPGKAALAVCLAVPAVVYIKSSGLFMAAVAGVALAGVFFRKNRKWSAGVLAVCGCLALAVCAYLLWSLHVRATFPMGMQTKHAVSLSLYAARIRGLDVPLVWTIAKKMVKRMLRPGLPQIVAFLYVILCGLFCAGAARAGQARGDAVRRAWRGLLGALAAYFAWEAMLFLMYVFSMPADEARQLASYGRYLHTSTILMIGLTTLAAAALAEGVRLPAPKMGRIVGAALLGGLVLAVFFGQSDKFWKVFRPERGYVRQRVTIQRAREEAGFADGGSYLFFWCDRENKLPDYTLYYFAKFEYDAPEMDLIIKQDVAEEDYRLTSVREGAHEDDGTGHFAVIGTTRDQRVDPIQFLADHLDEYDAFIVADEDPAFDAELRVFLTGYAGDTPVWFSYK